MFRLRRILDDVTPANRAAMIQVQHILSQQFESLQQDNIERIPSLLRNPFIYSFRSLLYIAETYGGQVLGFALMSHDPDLKFCYLDYLASGKKVTGRGIGAALYERVREEAMILNTLGLFFECLPDDPELCGDNVILKQNAARLRFYEKYGAYPIINTRYETPISPEDDCPPYLVFDNLGQSVKLHSKPLKKIVSAILHRKYKNICSPEYITMVMDSIKDDPVKLRAAKYIKINPDDIPSIDQSRKIPLVVNDKHDIHHVREKGYVEAPVRIKAILSKCNPSGLFEHFSPVEYPEKHILAVHDRSFYSYIKRACTNLEPGISIYPYVFPVRNQTKPPRELAVRA
ncbi:acetylpolyamine amidohydrolase, partial [bacterium]|nr:acetylpolyamine amidohydrolase [candidate division CSSED10-310 bacterium]